MKYKENDKWKWKNKISKNCGRITKDITYAWLEKLKEKRRENGEEVFEAIKSENFPKLMQDIKSQIQETHGAQREI